MFLGYIDPGSGFTIFNAGGWLLSLLVGFFSLGLIFLKKIFNFFKKKRRIVLLLILTLIVLLLSVTVYYMIKKTSPRINTKIVILGFDGLDASKIESLLEKGQLPNFARLKQQGAYRRLITTNPAQSPVAWAGFSTGQNPGKNGIFDFIVRNPKDYKIDLATTKINGAYAQKTLKGRPFWKTLTQAGIPSVILDCPVAFPPDAIKGRMLSGMGVPDILGTEGTFTFYTSETLDSKKDIGGNVFHVKKEPEFILSLIGPRQKMNDGMTKQVRVPFKTIIAPDKKSIVIEHSGSHINLHEGQWSAWQDVAFNIGFLKNIRGIFKFFLVSIEPEFKLYISPIQFDPRAPYQAISHPKGYSKEIAEHLGLFHTQGMPIDTWSVNELRMDEKQLLQEADEIFKEKKDLLDYELGRFHEGVLFSYFDASDIIQHMFWRAIDPAHPMHDQETSKQYKDTIDMWYKKFDALLGEILNKIDKDTILIVLSDHGFNTFKRCANVNTWLKENGYLKLKDPLKPDREGLLKNIDWSQTKAYALGFGGIYINQKDRESQGIVSPGAETELLKKELSEKLENWIDEKTKQPIIHRAYKKEDIYKGPFVKDAPDIILGFAIGTRASWQTGIGAVPESLLEDNLKKWSGDHMFDPSLVPGIFFINKPIGKNLVSIYDVAPTILSLAGFSSEEIKQMDLDGEALL
jgi:predicted AlkP superfamily phosphohydrolase/phosphomutase